MSVITESPTWFILLCLVAGIVYAGALYFRDRFNRTYGSFLATILGTIRFCCIALLAFFLLKPLIKSINRSVEKPLIIFAQDNSQSLIVGKDSTYYQTAYREQLKQLIANFGDDYDIRSYRFGSGVREGIDTLNYNEKITDFSNLQNEIYNKYSGRNLGAVIIASDGLYNKGSNPVYGYKKLNVPVFTVALGDTSVHKDILLSKVSANRLAYLGNKFPMEVVVEGRKASGENATLTISRKGNILYSENINFSTERFLKTTQLSLDANEIGLQKYTVNITTIKDEITTANNRKDVFIDVLDGRQKVLILAQAPHPDINAMRDAITSNENYKADVFLSKDFEGDISKYSLAILHQLPSNTGNENGILTTLIEKNIPCLFIWGNATDFRQFNELDLGYSLNNYRNNSTDVNASFSEDFTLFSVGPEISPMFRIFPPLTVPFGDFSFSPGIDAAVYQQVGQIKTKKPLVSFNKKGEIKIGLISGEGIWRWRMAAFQTYESHDYFNEFFTKTVQYLASKEDKSLFRVNGKNDFFENEVIIFDAELYNPSFEPVVNKEIAMRIRNENGEDYTYNFSPDGIHYKLNAGQLPVGNYSYEASVNTDQGTLKEKGEFSVSALQLEIINTTADHRMLYQLATDNNGEMVYPNEMNSLIEKIRNKKEIVSVSYENKELNDLINYRWILFILIALLGTEWLLRKRAGTY